MFIDDKYIKEVLREAESPQDSEIELILNKAKDFKGLNHREVALLLKTEKEEYIKSIFEIAGKIKKHIYGNRIVMFAPLYVSDYCVNNCSYCGYKVKNGFKRRRLSMEEIRKEVVVLEEMGHKRLALEAGEDPKNCDIDYIIRCMETIYNMKFKNGEIRRLNINIAGTSIENYRRLREVGIGTYILFQETYHRESYEKVHLSGPKSDYEYHLNSFARAMEVGIDDVGAGVLFGLADPYYEVLSLMLHNEYLEENYGVGFHTISVPRICKIEGEDLSQYEHIVDDEKFKKIVAILRLAVPYTGLILSTRENHSMRSQLIKIGISQISAGSSVGVGGYSRGEEKKSQFQVTDNRSAKDIINWLLEENLIPSFCTACYRKGRTGDRFMELAKSGNIKNVCTPNALMTLCEYMLDYGDENTVLKVENILSSELPNLENERVRNLLIKNIVRIKEGERDLYI